MGGWYQGWDGGLGSCLNTPLGPSEITTATLAVAESSITTFFKFENNYSPFRHNENRCWNYWLYLISYTWQALCFGLYLAAWWIILVGRRVMFKIRNVILCAYRDSVMGYEASLCSYFVLSSDMGACVALCWRIIKNANSRYSKDNIHK